MSLIKTMKNNVIYLITEQLSLRNLKILISAKHERNIKPEDETYELLSIQKVFKLVRVEVVTLIVVPVNGHESL